MKKQKPKTSRKPLEKRIGADINEEQVLRVPVKLELVSKLTHEEHVNELQQGWYFVPPYGAWTAKEVK